MISHKQFGFLVLSLCIALFGALILTKLQDVRCKLPDKTLCTMLKKLETAQQKALYGVYTEDSVLTVQNVEWSLQQPQKHIIVKKDNTELFNAIFTDKMIYVKDYSNNRWWKQERKEADTYSYNLVFDPEQFLQKLYKRLSDTTISYKKGQNVLCAQGACIRYQLALKENQEYIDIDRSSGMLRTYSLTDETGTKTLVIQEGEKIIEEPDVIQTAPAGTNIFLESTKNAPVNPKSQDLEYVKQFEKQRNQAEQQSSSSAQ